MRFDSRHIVFFLQTQDDEAEAFVLGQRIVTLPISISFMSLAADPELLGVSLLQW